MLRTFVQLRLLRRWHFLHVFPGATRIGGLERRLEVLLKAADCNEGSSEERSIKLTPKSLNVLQLPGCPKGTSFSFLDSVEGHPRDSEPMELRFELVIDRSSCVSDIDLLRDLWRGPCMGKGSWFGFSFPNREPRIGTFEGWITSVGGALCKGCAECMPL